MPVRTTFEEIISNPYSVQNDKGTEFLVMRKDEPFPISFALMGTTVGYKVVLRIAGGCKNMTVDDKRGMLRYFIEAFVGYRGLLFSGGTRTVTESGELDPMVTDVPGVIARFNPERVALGTIPRTGTMRFVRQLNLVLDEYGTIPNPSMDGLLVVQKGPSSLERLDWNGDLDKYFELMENWLQYGFSRGGLVSWNGGLVTREEIVGCLNRGWPVFLVAGSGRATDDVITELDTGAIGGVSEKYLSCAVVVPKEDPSVLRRLLIEYGFLESTDDNVNGEEDNG